MIKGKIRGVDFEFDDGEITSKDEEVEETLKEMFKLLLMDYELKDGLPELIFLEKLKKFGAKDLKYTPTDEEYDFIQPKEDVVGDEYVVEDWDKEHLVERVKGMFHKWFNKNPLKKKYSSRGQSEIGNFINPDYDKNSIKTTNNCYSCVVANELLRRGFPVKSVNFDKNNIIINLQQLFNVKVEHKNIDLSYEDLDNEIGSEERYFVSVPYYGDNGYHIIMAEKNKNSLVLYDSQTNSIYDLYNQNVDMSEKLDIVRVDNLKDKDFKKDFYQYSLEAEEFFKD